MKTLLLKKLHIPMNWKKSKYFFDEMVAEFRRG